MSRAREMYLDLLEKSLTGVLTEDPARAVFRHDESGFLVPAETGTGQYDPAVRAAGLDWPQTAPTMVGLARLRSLRFCFETVLADAVPGDFLEAGVWRGGAGIYLRALMRLEGVEDRRIWLADAFQTPPPNPQENSWDRPKDLAWMARLSRSVDEVRRTFESYGMLDERVLFLRGWFRDTLPRAPIRQLAILRLDGDLYESTRDALEALYDRVSPGGYVIIDDYLALEACKAAVDEFRRARGESAPLEPIDSVAVFWRRGKELS